MTVAIKARPPLAEIMILDFWYAPGENFLAAQENATRRVLVVDDEESVRLVVQSCLEELAGWKVLAAASGAAGLALAIEQRPDAIILDVMMPGMDGLTFLKKMQDHPELQDTPTILLTAKVELTAPEHYLAYGAVGALAKPFDPMKLIQQVQVFLGWD
jgi:CheY-like chemotaxis protein